MPAVQLRIKFSLSLSLSLWLVGHCRAAKTQHSTSAKSVTNWKTASFLFCFPLRIHQVEFHECLPDFLPVLRPQVDVSCTSQQVPTPVTFNIHESLSLSSSSSSSLSSSAAATAAKVNSTMHGKNRLKLQWSKASIHNSRSLHFDSMATVAKILTEA